MMIDVGRRDYHIDTLLASGGKAEAVIVVSSKHQAYANIASRIQTRLQELSGALLPIIGAEDVTTEEVLSKTNAIVLGNLVTSKFVESLYWQWYTLLDLWYPGPGGYVVRSLHDPYGTGYNVIFVGGSDDAGVAEAGDVFCHLLEPGNVLQVGYLAEIKLGDNHRMPPRGQWVDPRLRIFNKELPWTLGYTEASRAGLIYYYNGDEEAGKHFRDLARNTDVLWATDHYFAHMHAIVWDLIEESPLFTEEDRCDITERLLRHAQGDDGSRSADYLLQCAAEGSYERHRAMTANCMLTTSRYFGKYWPSQEWDRNLEAVRTYFDKQMTLGKGSSDLGGRGLYTYLESVLFPALLMRDRRLIDSGALEHFARLCLMSCDNTGYMPHSGQNSFDSYPTNTFMKCASLLNKGEFLVTAPLRGHAEQTAGFSVPSQEFLAGQAWATGVEPRCMKEMIGVYHLPLTQLEHSQRGAGIPFEKSFDKLTMRSGFGLQDQYLILEGIHGGPDSKPWPDVNSIAHFTQYGRIFLISDMGGENPVNHNVVTVCKEGFGTRTGRTASLEATADLQTFGYSHSRAHQHAFSLWDRHIVWRKGSWLMVLDDLKMNEEGHYSLECQWRTIGEPAMENSDFSSTLWEWNVPNAPKDVFHIKNAQGLPLCYSHMTKGMFEMDTKAWDAYCQRKGINRMRQMVNRYMLPGEHQVFTNLLYVGGDRTGAHFDISPIDERVAVITGDELTYVGLADTDGFRRGRLTVRGRAFSAGTKSFAVVYGQELGLGEQVIHASKPCNFEWCLSSGEVVVQTEVPVEVVAGKSYSLQPGTHYLQGMVVRQQELDLLRRQILEDAKPTEIRVPCCSNGSWPSIQPSWSYTAGSPITALHTDAGQDCSLVGLADGRVLNLDKHGRLQWEFRFPEAVRAIATMSVDSTSAVVVGCDDEQVYVLDQKTRRMCWQYRCHLPEVLYSWWTTDLKAKLQAILVDDIDGDGHPEIICGTGGGCVEVISHDGKKKWQRHIQWGIPDRLCLVPMPDGSKSIVVSNSYSSSGSTVWQLDPQGEVLSPNIYDNGRGDWDMTAVPCLLVTTLDSTGRLYALVGRKNAYNEAALYDAVTGERHWLHLLGDWVSAFEAVDINGDGVKELIIGSPSSWLCAFDLRGEQLWAAQMPHEIVAVYPADTSLLVACNDNVVYGVDYEGRIMGRLFLEGQPFRTFTHGPGYMLIADDAGVVYCLDAK